MDGQLWQYVGGTQSSYHLQVIMININCLNIIMGLPVPDTLAHMLTN